MIDLEAIEARANAATPGPWTVMEDDAEDNTIRVRGKIVAGVVATVHVRWMHEEQRIEQAANARFIAGSRSDVDAMIAEIRSLRAQLNDSRDASDPFPSSPSVVEVKP